ncbi:Cos5p [Saccharomyces cerevisiae S288C]|uniref:Protein COS5 n=1 Tax=Saccharomyces cerevisiae (strain ATCC 204508 / S288c) TaxID=559292 RepID=COS5_YEAST|nr:Cos5p [Saccharomyces cerevisiae S288C]P47187.1 RecName: Full=Protein COS5 [Saccharomyces cerevisiae S288C]CAA89694.1 COS5 [Saccharomyces cerevisiae]DAA08945.1 TPA: Cos5p [Saccharomyces cerevisiae S288C]|eukprot:NP_012695.3 Cos5p [Saccharomyces cerevisiae S288C]
MKENELKNEKSVDVLSFKQLESQKIVLPQDLFRSSFTWFCYEIYKSLAFPIWMLLWLPLSVWWKLSNNCIYPLIVSLLVLFLGPIFVLVICGLSRKRSLSKQLIQFCKEVTENTPSSDPHDWEVVAANLNSYLYENKAWNTRYFFFNAMGCQEAFRTTLLEPFSLKKDEAAKVKSFKDSVPYIEEALGVYFREVEKQWKLFNTEKSWSPVGLEDVQLPKDIHRSKLTWFLKRIFTIYSLPLWLAFLNCICVSQHFCLAFRILCPGLFFLMMVWLFQNMRTTALLVKMEHKMQFLLTIINEQESGANGWDEIARKMNRYLFEKKAWKNEEFFFEGIDCEWFFSHFFYRLLSAKKSMWLLPLNVELWPYIKEAQLSRNEESLMKK